MSGFLNSVKAFFTRRSDKSKRKQSKKTKTSKTKKVKKMRGGMVRDGVRPSTWPQRS